MALEGAGHLVSADPKEASARITRAVDERDNTIREIRTTIFALQKPVTSARPGLRSQLLAVADTATESLGFPPSLQFEGPVDSAVPDDVAEDVVAVVRESLSNTARHAGASAADVRVQTGSTLTVTVHDNGVGMAPTGRRSG